MSVPDELFARTLNQMGVATLDQIEAALHVQAESLKNGTKLSLARVLLQQGIITTATRENVEKKALIAQQGGIKQLGAFKILKKLGEGGMGAVYLADDTVAGRQVALKVLPKKYAADQTFLSRFRREAKATGRLNHVNIVAVYTMGEDLGVHYYAMEFCDGEPLDALLKRSSALPWDKAIEITMQVARGLKHAHEHNLIHRDIKPANIFITREGVAKILDLGLAKNIVEADQSFNTQTGVALGTPHYISPEQARGDKAIDGRTDIYSLGATLYHLITGQTPFQGSTAAMIMMRHITGQLPNPQDLNDNIPDGVVTVIQRMMSKEPGDRYRDCDALQRDLELVIDGKLPSTQGLDAGKSSIAMRQNQLAPRRLATRGNPQIPQRKSGPIRRPISGEHEVREIAEKKPAKNPLVLIGAGAAAVVLLIVGVLALSGGKKADEVPRMAELNPPIQSVSKPPEALTPESKVVIPENSTTVSDAWVKKVQALPAEEQIRYVTEELRRVNESPNLVIALKIVNGRIIDFACETKEADKLRNLAPLRALKDLERVRCACTDAGKLLRDLTPLKGLKLKSIQIPNTAVSDLSPLRGMPLENLEITGTPVSDLSPLSNSKLSTLMAADTRIDTLAALKDVPLHSLSVTRTAVEDLSPIKNMPALDKLWIQDTRVTNLDALRNSAVTELSTNGCLLTDHSQMRYLPKISRLSCDVDLKHDLDWLRSLKTLAFINNAPAAEFLAKAESCDPVRKDEPWRETVDLISLTDTRRDKQGGGNWTQEGSSLLVDNMNTSNSTLCPPYRIGEEFDFRFVFTRLRTTFDLYLQLPVGSKYCSLRLTDRCFLGTGPDALIANRGIYCSLIQECVLRSRKGSLQIFLDGELLFDVPAAKLEILATDKSGMRDPARFGISFGAQTRAAVHRLQVREVRGRGGFTRPDEPTALAAEKKRGGATSSTPSVPAGQAVQTGAVPPAALIAAVSENVDDPARWEKAINLLALVDVEQDAAIKKWHRRADGVADSNLGGIIEIPFHPPEEYDFSIEFNRSIGNGAVCQFLSKNGKSFRWAMGADFDKVYGFDQLNGKSVWDHNNPTRITPDEHLTDGIQYRSTVQVRNTGVKAYLNGKLLCSWNTDYKDIISADKFSVRDPKLLGLGLEYNGIGISGVFHSAKLIEISGSGSFVRPSDPAAMAADKKRGHALLASKLPCELLLADVYGLLNKNDFNGARAKLDAAKTDPKLAHLRAALEKESACVQFIEDINKAAASGAALLADKRAFTLKKATGSEMATGKGSRNTVTSIRDGVISIDQDLGGAQATAKWKLSDLAPQTRFELAALSFPPGPETDLKFAFAHLMALDGGPSATTPDKIRQLLESALKRDALKDLAAHLAARLEAREREMEAAGALKKFETACKAAKWKDALDYMHYLKHEYGETVTVEHSKELIDKRWNETNAQASPLRIANAPADEEWCTAVRLLPALDQVEMVVNKLRELNPLYDGRETHVIDQNNEVIAFGLDATKISDIAPIHALAALDNLDFGRTDRSKVANLLPLKGLPLTLLNIHGFSTTELSALSGMKLIRFDCGFSRVENISALKGAPLTFFSSAGGPLKDLAPLADSPLKDLQCNADILPLNVETLRKIKTLEKINGKLIADFWKEFGGAK